MANITIPTSEAASEAAADLRRRRNAQMIQIVVRRADLLEPGDKALLQAVYREGLRIADVAALRGPDSLRRTMTADANTEGMRPQGVRALRRRVRLLVARVLSPSFEFVLAHQRRWTPTRRRIADAAFIRGLSMRRVAERTGASLHTVRKHLDAIRALMESRQDNAACGPRRRMAARLNRAA